MNHIESYNASYPLSYYKIGTVYSFYGTGKATNTTAASVEQISKYSGKLIALEQEEAKNAIKPMSGNVATHRKSGGLSRYYAVVVDKISQQKSSGIIVMFINRDGDNVGYLLKKYAVSHPVHLDGKDLMPAKTSTSLGFDESSKKSDLKPGHLTHVKDEKVGQLTHSHKQAVPSGNTGSVGQLTHTVAPKEPEQRVGRLTLSKK